jgi:hypothetical protein
MCNVVVLTFDFLDIRVQTVLGPLRVDSKTLAQGINTSQEYIEMIKKDSTSIQTGKVCPPAYGCVSLETVF